MRIGRTLPPAAVPIGIRDIVGGIHGMANGQKELNRFQSELEEHFGVKHCFLVSSGKAALTLVLLALKDLFPTRDEVLIPAFTCYSVPSSVIRAGLKIRLCDLEPDGLDFDFTQLLSMISRESLSWDADTSIDGGTTDLAGERPSAGGSSAESTRRLLAIVPAHLFGVPAAVPRLRTLVRDPGVTVVEDAAQAMGETWEGRKLGTLGDIGFFSLGRGKAFCTVEGGVILTNRDDIADTLVRRIANLPSYSLSSLLSLVVKAVALMLFLHPWLFWIPRSMPVLKLGETLFEPQFPILKMSSFQAGLARNWRSRLKTLCDRRKENVCIWSTVLQAQGASLLQVKNHLFGLIRFPLIIRDAARRDALLREGAARGFGIMPAYPDAIGSIPEVREQVGAQKCPVAEGCARQLVTVPTHGYLTENDVSEISRVLFLALVP